MENESLKQACLRILSQVAALQSAGADSDDGQSWFFVADTSVRIGLAESPDGQTIALMACSADEPGEPPRDMAIWAIGAFDASDSQVLASAAAPAEPEMATNQWVFVSEDDFGLYVKGDTGEAVAIQRLTRADFARPDAAPALGEWLSRAIFAFT